MNMRAFCADHKDYAARMRLVNLQYPDDLCSIADLRHADVTRPHDVWRRQLIVEKNGEVVAFGAIGQAFWTSSLDQYFVQVDVDPACLGKGIGTSVFTRLVEMAQTDNQVSMLTAECREDLEPAVAFLNDKGFNIDIRKRPPHWRSTRSTNNHSCGILKEAKTKAFAFAVCRVFLSCLTGKRGIGT